MWASTALVVFLSTAKVLASNKNNNDHVNQLVNNVNSSYQQKKKGDVNGMADQRRVAQLEQPTIQEGVAADVGVLGITMNKNRRRPKKNGRFFGGNNNRNLQEIATPTELDTCPKPDTCEPSLCACVSAGGKAYDCAAELNAVCQGVVDSSGKTCGIEGCVNYPDYYNNLYCPYAKCLIDGGTKGTCGCEFYQESCETYRDDPEYSDSEDILQHCGAAACCEAKDEDDHLGKEECFDESPTSMPSTMPSGPTVSPTTLSPAATPVPTVVSTAAEEEEEIATPTVSGETEGVPSSAAAETPTSSSAQSVASGVVGTTVVAAVVWSLLG